MPKLLLPTPLHDFKVDFIVVVPQLIHIPQVATIFFKAIVRLRTLPINIRMLYTNYQDIVLTPFFVNVPKFHAKIKKTNYYQL